MGTRGPSATFALAQLGLAPAAVLSYHSAARTVLALSALDSVHISKYMMAFTPTRVINGK